MSLHELDNGSSSGLPNPKSSGLWGDSNTGIGVLGTSKSLIGVLGESISDVGVVGNSESNAGMLAFSEGSGTGIVASSNSGTAIDAHSTTGFGISGVTQGNLGTGVVSNLSGVSGVGLGDAGYGVYGESVLGIGVAGIGDTSTGVYGVSNSVSGYAGFFNGTVVVTGLLVKAGGSTFKIDHPLDPAKKYLSHSIVESPDMKNIYDGVVFLDEHGEAEVELPTWFESLNTDFRYQLTCIGKHAPVYIDQEVRGNRFRIAGGMRGMKVSWQVTGIRQDTWAKAHPIEVETEKRAEEQGYYLHPELHGEPKEKSIDRLLHPQVGQPQPQRTPPTKRFRI